MEYISAKEFLKQPKEVQEVFLDWWKPSVGDLFTWIGEKDMNDCREIQCNCSRNMAIASKKYKGVNTGNRIPLLTEGQLRKFIEDKKSGIIDIGYYGGSEGGYDINIFKLDYKKEFIMNDETDRLEQYTFEKLGEDLLQAYWKVACQIANTNKED